MPGRDVYDRDRRRHEAEHDVGRRPYPAPAPDARDTFLAYSGAGHVPTGPADDHGPELDLWKYVHGIRRRWPLILVCILVGVAYALVRFALTPKMYESKTTIQIERKRLSLMALGQAGWLEDWWNMEYYPTQYRLLRSRGMAERVVLNLRLHQDPSFNPRAASLVPGGGSEQAEVDSSTELAHLAEKVRAGLDVRPIEDTQLVDLVYRARSPELAARIANGYAEVFIEWGIETRSSTVGQASSFLAAQIGTLRREIEERRKQLNAFTAESDQTLDPDGQALVDRRQTLEQNLNSVLAERISREARYRELLAQDPETVANAAAGGRVDQLRSELFSLESEYRSKLDTYTEDWPEMVSLQQEITRKRSELQQLVQDVYEETVAEARAQLQQSRRETGGIREELDRLNAEAQTYNSETLEYENLKTLINTRRELLTELVKRQSETEVASRMQGSQESNVRIVERAVVPRSPYAPVLQGDLVKALLLALMVGTGAIVLLEYFDRTLKGPEELESLLGLPTLAVIPDIDDEGGGGFLGRYRRGYGYGYGYSYGYSYGYGRPSSASKKNAKKKRGKPRIGDGDDEEQIELLPHHRPRLAVSEAYRSLRTALLLSTADELRVVSLTSAVPGEGKTATTTNLATVVAQLGRRVLIIDGDLRRPRMHKIFRTSNRFGLVNYLTGRAEIESLVFETKVPNLFLCPSGPIPPNPSELLASDRMETFVAAMRERFDFVLIDCPPALPVADAVIVGTMADAVLLCARAGVLIRDDAKLCRERLSYADLRLVGAVLNRYRTTPGRYNKQKYRYYGTYEEAKRPASSAA